MVTIGCGCGAALDWIEPSKRLLEEGLDYVILETIGSAATCQAGKRAHEGKPGYHPYLEDRLEAILKPAARHRTTIVTNAGIVDPLGAGELARDVAERMGVSLQVIAITGDDCMSLLDDHAEKTNIPIDEVLSANAYIGAEEIVGALTRRNDQYDAHLVIGGRIADPSLVVGPLAYEFDWTLDDWTHLGRATVIGHLLECSAQVTGGFFADPPRKPVSDLHRIGYPYADVSTDGTAILTKPDATGGRVDEHTVREQLFYEVHDPAAYVTPDVVADFTSVEFTPCGPDEIKITGGGGRERPVNLKVLLGTIAGYQFEKYIPIGGPNAVTRAELTKQTLEDRLEHIFDVNRSALDLRMELLGLNALYSDADDTRLETDREEPEELLLRIAGNAPEREILEPVMRTVSTTLPGPAGHGVPFPYSAGGIRKKTEITPIYVSRAEITPNVVYHDVTAEEV